ncbi:sensor histidine kinase [Agrilactobacillus fermenti]|uniref:sensor histidine kinase n=1 Tax=Agrilactobacillus fermenti TaxID=2586909 RepID=UPI003A5C6540
MVKIDYTKRNLLTIFGLIVVSTLLDSILFTGINILLLPLGTIFIVKWQKLKLVNKANIALTAIITTLLATNVTGLISLKVIRYLPASGLIRWLPFALFNMLLAAIFVYAGTWGLIFLIQRWRLLDVTSTKANLIIFPLLLVVAIPFISSIFVAQIQNLKTKMMPRIILMIVLLLVVIATIVMVALKIITQNLKRRLEQRRQADMLQYLKNLEAKNLELRRFKHDFQNTLLTISVLLQKSDFEDIELLIKDLTQEKHLPVRKSVTNEYEMIDNIKSEILKGMVINKLFEAEEQNIAVDLEIESVPEISKADSVKLAKIMGILFDNAIEAVRDSTKNLSFAVLNGGDTVELIWRNALDKDEKLDLQQIFKSTYSTKGRTHGLGLSTVKQLVDDSENLLISVAKNHGEITFTLTYLVS